MSTYALLPADRQRAAPCGAPRLALFLSADLARAYREGHDWAHACEIAELPALEVLRAFLRASHEGIPTVAVDPADGLLPEARFERSLKDPWTAFVEFLEFERAALARERFDVPADGFSDPRVHHELPQSVGPSADRLSEFESVVLDLTAAQLLGVAGSVGLAKHALDIVSEYAAPEHAATDCGSSPTEGQPSTTSESLWRRRRGPASGRRFR